ncbi:AAA family ATPase [Streptomyces cheonanensis]|uniref:AAA family ATPase n=1 Tax=Streptomyces cheonanensis TaxID=312720 RepID=A0ABP5GSA6_9ACTN
MFDYGAAVDPTPLIGREHPAGVLRSAVARARDSHGGLILVTGEAGIGKTTLVAGAAEEARRGGALVLGGSCWEAAGTPGYWPWTQVLRALRRAEPGTVLDGPLAALLGDPHTGTAPEADAFALHDAVTSALVAAAQHRPVLVVLDDLHWADGASLRLLEFAARHTWFERLLLIGVHRDTGPEGPPAVSAPATTLALTGLSRDETGALLARTTGEAPDAALIDATHRRTGGNPFFIEQTAALGEITPGVRDALHRRLALLSAPVTALLGHAAVLGREFGLPLLAAVSGTHPAEAAALLRQAVTARLLTPPTGDRYGFAHDLVREVLYEALPAAHARDRHAAAVRALGDGAPPAERARHARLAGDTLPPADRLEILQAAAADATNRLAHEEATGHLRHAHRLARAGDDARARVLTGLRYGESVRDWDVLRRTADEARELDDPGLLARVALSLYRVEGEEHRPFQAEMLLAATRALTRAGHVAAPGPAGSWAELERLARKVALQAAVRARRGGDDATLAFSLLARYNTIWSPEHAAEREVLTREILALARRTGDIDAEHFGMALRWVALVELGDPGYAAQLREFAAVGRRRGLPRYRLSVYTDEAIGAALRGDFALADRQWRRLRELAQAPEAECIPFADAHLTWSFGLLRGRYDELDALHARLTAHEHPCPELLAGITAAHRGDRPAVLRTLAAIGTDGDRRYAGDMAALWLRFQAQAAEVTADRALALRARDAIAPHEGRWAVALYGYDIGGPMALWRGVAEAALGDRDAAVAAFEAAAGSADALGARPWALEARTRLAAALTVRGGPGDTARATELRDRVRAEAAALGLATGGPLPAANVFRPGDGAAGEEGVWTLTYDGVTVHVPDAKGLHDLRQLIANPGTGIPATSLLSPDPGAPVPPGADPVLDDEARARYQRHLAALDEEIDRAAALGRDEKATALDAERAALVAELRAAAGLAGRPRRLGDAAERARKTVTARIRDTLRKLDVRHPALAAHLRASVTTGTHCTYRPAEPAHFRL